MSRSGYSDDCENPIELYRQAVENAILGKRGQKLMRRLRDALDAMPVKRLITDKFSDKSGVCALGAIDPSFKPSPQFDDWDDSNEVVESAAKHFNIAPALAAEIMFLNDEWDAWRSQRETPEERWTRMRAWVEKQIGPDEDAA